jgi:predicted GNAT superfamily acetyltransferase
VETPIPNEEQALLLVEIPSQFMEMRSSAPELARRWRIHSRLVFQRAFDAGYLITDFVHGPSGDEEPRQAQCFYVLSYGESTL